MGRNHFRNSCTRTRIYGIDVWKERHNRLLQGKNTKTHQDSNKTEMQNNHSVALASQSATEEKQLKQPEFEQTMHVTKQKKVTGCQCTLG